jgi:hypothetical protein
MIMDYLLKYDQVCLEPRDGGGNRVAEFLLVVIRHPFPSPYYLLYPVKREKMACAPS